MPWHTCRADDTMLIFLVKFLSEACLAEGVGFEPTREREPPAGFQDRCLKPLGHPSKCLNEGRDPRLQAAGRRRPLAGEPTRAHLRSDSSPKTKAPRCRTRPRCPKCLFDVGFLRLHR